MSNWDKQNEFHWNLTKGFDLYTDDATGLIEIKVPIGTNPVIAGYTKQSSHPAGKWHNGAETQLNAPSCPELVVADKQFTTPFWLTLSDDEATPNDIEYADIVDNYEDKDTLFADTLEDNKRMKLLQYKTPLTE